MSKGLEELKEIELKWQYGVFTFIPNFEIIKKELKALEILLKYISIKECDDIFPYYIEDKQYVSNRSGNVMTKKEYDLLKSIINDTIQKRSK